MSARPVRERRAGAHPAQAAVTVGAPKATTVVAARFGCAGPEAALRAAARVS